MLNYLRKESQFGPGEEMMDVIRTPHDVELSEQETFK